MDSDSSSDVSEKSAEAPQRVTQGTALKRPKVQYAGKRPPQKSYPSSSLFVTEAEEDEDEDDLELDEDDLSDLEEEDDDEEEDGGVEQLERQAGRATKRPKRNLFVEDEAEVDEDEEDEEELDEEYDKDFVDEAQEAEALQPEVYRNLERRLETEDFQDVDEVTRRLKERYSQREYAEAGEYMGDTDRMPMQFLLPTPKDAHLWLVKCKPGRERDIVLNLMRKYLDYQGTEHELRIKSVVAREGLKGYIYIEARSMSDVQAAVDKMNNIYASKISIVPMDEMVDVVTIRKKVTALRPGSWVRIQRGKYKGDLAQVVDVYENEDTAEVKVIPRLAPKDKESGQKRKAGAARDPSRLLNVKDIDRADINRRNDGRIEYNGDVFDAQGFHYRVVKLNLLQIDGVRPSLDELARFSITAEGEQERVALVSSVQDDSEQSTFMFSVGDRAVVNEGELKNALGTVINVDKNSVILKMQDEALGEVNIEPGKLNKFYQLGDHVKVIRGKHKDDMGMITQVQDQVITIFSDLNLEQISVFSKDIQSVGEVSITENQQQVSYKLHDFVQVGATTVAVIIKVERDQYRIIDQFGAIRMIKGPEITQKKDSRRAVALDASNRTIQVNDKVKVMSGDHIGREGSILHLYRSWAFLYNKDFMDTAGVFVVRTRMVTLAGVTDSQGRPASAAPGRPGAPIVNTFQGNRRDPILNKTVIITGGPYKGYQGIAKNISDKGVRVELHTNGKVVTVDRNRVIEKDESQSGPRRNARFSGIQTLMIGSKTPNVALGAQTPSHMPARTPAWDASARTPAWDAGARTPAAWEAASRTPNVRRDIDDIDEMQSASASGWEQDHQQQEKQQELPELNLPPNWLLKNMCVLYLPKMAEAVVIDTLDGNSASILIDGKTTQAVTAELRPVQPLKRDACVQLDGAYRGMVGELKGLDSEEAIVKLALPGGGEDLFLDNIFNLCKVATNASQ